MKPHFWGYLFGTVFLTAFGLFVQTKFIPEPDMGVDEDDIMYNDTTGQEVMMGKESLLESN